MHFAAYPNPELMSPYTYIYYLNGPFNVPYHYAAEANVLPNSAMYFSNNSLVTTMMPDPKNYTDNKYFNIQGENLQEMSLSYNGQLKTSQDLCKSVDVSSHTKINSRIIDWHGRSNSETSSQAASDSRNISCNLGPFLTLDKYSETSSQARLNSTNNDFHSGPAYASERKNSATSSQAGIHSRNVDFQSGLVPVDVKNCSETDFQSRINPPNIANRAFSNLDQKYSETSSQADMQTRTADCHSGTVLNLHQTYSETSFQARNHSRTNVEQENNSKSFEIWRPFCSSPTRETSVEENQQNFPNRMKIEHSKTSLFKPVKKRDYKCRYCVSSFASSAQLNSHLRVHTGSKPFHCPACRKRFARNEELTRHSRIHSGYKPHACRTCGKSFGRKDHLAKHAKTHLRAEEKRQYVCPLPGCEHRYTRSDALTRHRTSAHATYRGDVELKADSKKLNSGTYWRDGELKAYPTKDICNS